MLPALRLATFAVMAQAWSEAMKARRLSAAGGLLPTVKSGAGAAAAEGYEPPV
jgi:hypothetical protein